MGCLVEIVIRLCSGLTSERTHRGALRLGRRLPEQAEPTLSRMNLDRRCTDIVAAGDLGQQFAALPPLHLAFGRRCDEAGVRPAIGSVGDCFDKRHVRKFLRHARMRTASTAAASRSRPRPRGGL